MIICLEIYYTRRNRNNLTTTQISMNCASILRSQQYFSQLLQSFLLRWMNKAMSRWTVELDSREMSVNFGFRLIYGRQLSDKNIGEYYEVEALGSRWAGKSWWEVWDEVDGVRKLKVMKSDWILTKINGSINKIPTLRVHCLHLLIWTGSENFRNSLNGSKNLNFLQLEFPSVFFLFHLSIFHSKSFSKNLKIPPQSCYCQSRLTAPPLQPNDLFCGMSLCGY